MKPAALALALLAGCSTVPSPVAVPAEPPSLREWEGYPGRAAPVAMDLGDRRSAWPAASTGRANPPVLSAVARRDAGQVPSSVLSHPWVVANVEEADRAAFAAAVSLAAAEGAGAHSTERSTFVMSRASADPCPRVEVARLPQGGQPYVASRAALPSC